jgi:hypothetical protein
MSALGQKQTYAVQNGMSAAQGHVCFTPESGHVQCTSLCPLWAKSGHLLVTGAFEIKKAASIGGLGIVLEIMLYLLEFPFGHLVVSATFFPSSQ